MTPLHPVVLASLLCAAAAPACSPSSATPPPQAAAPPIAVRVAPVHHQKVSKPIIATGVVAPKSEVKASFKVGGIVDRVTVRAGDTVRRGQLLAVLRSTEVDAVYDQVQHAAVKAERDLARVKSLFDSQAATREQLEDATTAADVARAQLRAAAFNREHAVISAPGDGRVLRRLVEPNELVGPGQPVLVLGGDAASWVLRAGLTDRDVVRIAEGSTVQVELSAWPGTQLSGTVREIASTATPVGTYEIDVAFVAPGKTLRAGLIGRIRIEAPAEREMNVIPATALRDGDGDGATVWSANTDGSVTPHAVKVAFFTGELVALSSGLDGVSAVITDGSAYLSAHSRIEVMPAARPAAANPRGTP